MGVQLCDQVRGMLWLQALGPLWLQLAKLLPRRGSLVQSTPRAGECQAALGC